MSIIKLLSSLAVRQSLYTARLMYGFVAIMYPLNWVVFELLLDNNKDPLYLRLIFSAIVTSIFISTYRSQTIKKWVKLASFFLFYVATFYSQYLVYLNDHRPEYLVCFAVVIMASSIVLKDLKSLGVFSLIVISEILLESWITYDTLIYDRFVEVILFGTALLASGMIISVREDFASRLVLSDQIINRFKGIVLVFDSKEKLAYSNQRTIDFLGLKSDANIFDPKFHQRLLKLQEGNSLESTETVQHSEIRWFEWKLSKITMGYSVFIGHDITKIKLKEQERIHMSLKAQNYANRVRALRKLDQAIIGSESFEETISRVLNFIKHTVPDSLVISLLSFKAGQAEISASIEKLGEVRFLSEPIPHNQLPDEEILRQQQYAIKDLRIKKRLSYMERKCLEKGVVTLYTFSIKTEGRPIACVKIGFPKVNELSEEQLTLLGDLTQGLGVYLQQLELKNQLQLNNEEINKTNDELQRVNEELRQFAYITSHDLKAPLRAVNSLVQFIQEDHVDELGKEAMEKLDLVHDRIDRMDALINGILEYSRVGRLHEEKSEVRLGVEIQAIISSLSPHNSTEIVMPNELPVLSIELTRIHQIFQNLISNAIKFVDPNKGVIEIGYLESSEYLTFFVKDNGPGIAPQYHEKIFSLFDTGSRKKSNESTGVGLTIVKKNVELFGGKLWLDSEVDAYTCFYFTLPAELKIRNEKLVEEEAF